MGYNTSFDGQFDFDKPLGNKTYFLLKGLSETRRVKRRVGPEYGIEGEFWCEDKVNFGQNDHPNKIADEPPSTQPGLWCGWEPSEDRIHLQWNGAESFYDYVDWLKYLIEKVIQPAGYTLNGMVEWEGEEQGDVGKIIVKDNAVTTKEGKIVYE